MNQYPAPSLPPTLPQVGLLREKYAARATENVHLHNQLLQLRRLLQQSCQGALQEATAAAAYSAGHGGNGFLAQGSLPNGSAAPAANGGGCSQAEAMEGLGQVDIRPVELPVPPASVSRGCHPESTGGDGCAWVLRASYRWGPAGCQHTPPTRFDLRVYYPSGLPPGRSVPPQRSLTTSGNPCRQSRSRRIG